ncbi:hypothetical protein GGR52DRAFT_416978 [Hypoxylon sp. FL1284]|nr:hypothetical protein GGR52DRAFT_416978 [Hypoxylon sp. FL1284]
MYIHSTYIVRQLTCQPIPNIGSTCNAGLLRAFLPTCRLIRHFRQRCSVSILNPRVKGLARVSLWTGATRLPDGSEPRLLPRPLSMTLVHFLSRRRAVGQILSCAEVAQKERKKGHPHSRIKSPWPICGVAPFPYRFPLILCQYLSHLIRWHRSYDRFRLYYDLLCNLQFYIEVKNKIRLKIKSRSCPICRATLWLCLFQCLCLRTLTTIHASDV